MQHLNEDQLFHLADTITEEDAFTEQDLQDMEHIGKCEHCFRQLQNMIEILEATKHAPELATYSYQEESPIESQHMQSAIVKIVVVDMSAIMEQIQTAATAWAFDAPLPVTTRGAGTPVSSTPKLEDIQNSNTYITYDPARRVLTIQVEPDARGVIPSAYLKFKDGSTQKIRFEARGRFFRAEVHNLTDGEYELLLEKG